MFKFLIVALAYAGIAFGGQMNLNMASPTDTALIKDFLTRIDSITFVQGSSPNVDDSLFMKVYHNNSDKQSLNYPLSWIQHIDFETVAENNESMTVDVGIGVGKGENTFLLKDIKTIEFVEMDDSLDSDGDGVTDVMEIFIRGTDPKVSNLSKVVSYNLYDTNSNQIGSLALSGTTLKMSFVPKGPVVIEVVMSDPTQSVTVATKDSSVEVTKVDSKHFKFTMPALLVADSNSFNLDAVSEAGAISRYRMSLMTDILFSDELVLSASADHQAINVNFAPSQRDGRITGYAILRAVGSQGVNNAALAKLSLTSSNQFIDKILPSGISVIKTIDAGSVKDYLIADGVARYTDPVGGLSPYYTYCVVAYVKENIDGKDVYSYKQTTLATKSVGNIVLKYQAVQFGTKYDTWVACRADMRLYADVFSLSTGVPENKNAKYNYWFYNAGSDDDKDKMVWEDKADSTKNHLNNIKLNKSIYTLYVDKKGVGILLANDSDCGAYSDKVRRAVSISYENIVEALTGIDATDWVEYVYTYGQDGVSYDGTCSNCGKKPHAGWKFNFLFEWAD